MNRRTTILVLILTVLLFAAYSFSREQNGLLHTVAGSADRRIVPISGEPESDLIDGQPLHYGEAVSTDPAASFVELMDGTVSKEDPDMTRGAAARLALNLLKEAAARNDRQVLDKIGQMGAKCFACDAFYNKTYNAMTAPELPANVRWFLANALAQSGTSHNQSLVVDQMKAAANNPNANESPSTFAQALQEAPLTGETVDQVSVDLASENPYVREAAVSILTKQGTVEAAQKLYDHTVERGDPDGYYRDGMGIAAMHPQAETLPYLEQLIEQRDQYSHLAVKALLNYGREGLDKVIEMIATSKDIPGDSKLLHNASDHIANDPNTLALMNSLSSSPNKALRNLADTVLREKGIDRDNLNKQIEYNDNWADNIIR